MADSEYTQRWLTPDEWPLWDDFVRKSSPGTVFQSTPYIHAVEQSFGRQAQILAVARNDTLLGGVVLFPKSRLGVPYCTVPYYLPYNGILLSDFPEVAYYYRRIQLQAKLSGLLLDLLQRQFAYCELHQAPHTEDLRPFVWRGWEDQPEFTAVVDLAAPDDLTRRMDRDQRRRLRRAEENNLQINDHCPPEALADLWEASYRHHGLRPPISRRALIDFSTRLLAAGMAQSRGCQIDGVYQAALLVIEDHPTVYALFSGKRMKTPFSGAELYLFYRTMAWYRERGYRRFDLLGAMVPSIAKVKLELGGVLERSDRLSYFRNGSLRGLFRLANRRNRLKRTRQPK